MKSVIKDISLAPSGHDKINWVKNFMPVMAAIDKEYSVSKPFTGRRMVMTMHLEAKTAYLALVLKNAGAAKINVIKIIREVTGLGLKEAKDIADAGGNVKENIPAEEANELKARLEEAGAEIELK